MWKAFRVHELEKLHRSSSSFQFGITMAIVFLVVAVWTQKWIVISMSVPFVVVSLVQPRWLDGLNRLWFLLGLFLGWLVSPLFLLLFYYLVFSPMALVLKVFGHKAFAKNGWVEKTKNCNFTRNF